MPRHPMYKRIQKILKGVKRQAEQDPSDQSDTIQLLCASFLKAIPCMGCDLGQNTEMALTEVLEAGLKAMEEDLGRDFPLE